MTDQPLATAFGDIPVVTKPDLVKRRSRDFYWYSPILKESLDPYVADIVVMPRNEPDIIEAVRICHANDIPLTVRGAGTGNYGQCIPLKGGVVLDLSGLDEIIWMRPGRARAQAGARMGVLEKTARETVGGELRLFPSTFRTATIGGFVAGGSSGIGAARWGLLRDTGNICALRVVTMEENPRVLELTGDDIQKVNHGYGTNGIITEVEIPLAAAVDWIDMAIAVPDFDTSVTMAQALSEAPGIQTRNVALVAAPIPNAYFGRLGERTPEGHHLVMTMVAAEDVDAARHLFARFEGATVVHEGPWEKSGLAPLAEFSWNHTTLRALKSDPQITYLQVLFAGPDRGAIIRESYAHFGDEVPMHLEFVHFGDHIGCFGLQLLRYSSPERLGEIMDWFEARGCPVFDPHAYTLEEGGMKEIDPVQLAFKREADPKGLLNPGKMIAWDDPSWTGRRPVEFMYASATEG